MSERGDGKKLDDGKARLSLIPSGPLNDVAECFEVGVRKYAAHAWRDGMAWSRPLDALLRHAHKWQEGEERDPIDGQKHLAAVVVNAMFLLEYGTTGAGTDDRYVRPRDDQ